LPAQAQVYSETGVHKSATNSGAALPKLGHTNLFTPTGKPLNNNMICATALATLALAACGGGGGGGTAQGGSTVAGGGGTSTVPVVALNATMLGINAPIDAGTSKGFNYATQSSTAVDIALSYPNGVVVIYAQRPTSSLYDGSGNPLSSPELPTPAVLTQGLSAATAGADGNYHFTATIAVPANATTVFLASPARIDVPIVNQAVTFLFSGALK
jgi:hypothetical protein